MIDEVYNMDHYFTTQSHKELFTQAICCNTIGTAWEATATEAAMINVMTKAKIDVEKVRAKHIPYPFTRF